MFEIFCSWLIKPWRVKLKFLAEFPQAMNFIVVRLLCDQFDELNEEFSKCIGDRGEFHGNFEQFRRRHHAICRSVHEADRFLMISNVGCSGCNIASLITVLFSSIFYRQHTLSRGPWDAVMYICWLVLNVFSLSLAIGMAILVNCKVTLWYSAYGIFTQKLRWWQQTLPYDCFSCPIQ